jgi:cobalt-zinc-cadmium efflux system outer membrane protein
MKQRQNAAMGLWRGGTMGGATVAMLMLCGPQPTGAQDVEPLTLAAALAAARTGNRDVQAAARVRDGAVEGARFPVPWPNPSFELRGENLGAPRTAAGPAHDLFAVIGQPLELPVKRRARRAQAAAAAAAGEATAAETWATVSLQTAMAYLGALRAAAVHALLDEHHAGVAELVRVMRERVTAATAAEGDLRRLELALATVDLSRLRLRLERDRELATLEALIASDRPIAPGRLVRPALSEPRRGSEDVEAAVARRPDVLAARARLAALGAARDVEAARWLPDPAVVAGYKRTAGVDTAVGGLIVALPLGDRNRRARAETRAAADAAGLELEAVQRRARAAMRTAADAQAAFSARLAGAAALVDAAEVVRTAVRTAFAEGTADLVRLLDAEQAWLAARREVEELTFDTLIAAVRARAAAGEELIP